ncbi:hypothetical protein AGR4C_Cc80391 [Agrobacterium tumefaciens str. Kerr 14]|uniref:Inosine/uridine-preferring nucleoside hydrolase domain-containing protein n=1 Tax=Agrobacterium tumefaciens str. Kerr 14 TaxID=1183424 RepID=A0A1S7QQG2_AGRTU|nr:hypothetical protein AGR4C_Cc80391 [Agrobacterium tumefaciens str. Kerr 14]
MHKVIFDTDPGVDDAMALLFLHRHPDIDLIGVTTVFGNAPIDITTRNALFLKREWQMTAPVARGAGVTFDPTARKATGRPSSMAKTVSAISISLRPSICRSTRAPHIVSSSRR